VESGKMKEWLRKLSLTSNPVEKRILKAGMRNIFISVITQCELSHGAL